VATQDLTQHSATLIDHLPVLVVLVPFIAAPLLILFGSRTLSWPIAFISSLLSLVMSAVLMAQTIGGKVISYHIGGWAPPLGIEYRVDAANAFILLLVSAISTVVLPYAKASVASEIPRKQHTLFYALFLLCLTGLLGVVVTGDAFNVFVFLEISSLSTYVLIAMGSHRDRRALTASYDYLIMGTIGATFFVIGLGLLYMMTGTLNMADMAERIADMGDNRTIRAAFAFIVVGIGLKVAIYPLHLWLPNAYVFAPSAVSVFLAATATKVAIYVLLRFMFSVFQPGFLFETLTLEFIIMPFAVLAMFAASFIAIFQSDLKRMLAYSSIAQIGYMLLGAAFLTQTGLTASTAHMFNHGITKATLFMGAGIFVWQCGGTFYRSIEGQGRLMPWTCGAIVIAGLSLIGVPGTAGFISKWVLVQAALENGWWPIAILIVMSSLLTVVYVWRLVEVLYLTEVPEGVQARKVPTSMLVPLWIGALSCIWFGLNTDLTITASQAAAEGLLAGTSGMR
jgi:multicomponent Na+:H+ antiporter subunit D